MSLRRLFSSISQLTLHRLRVSSFSVLQHLEIPANVRYFARALCEGNGCEISLLGACHKGFSIRASIRQGCPLSPFLLALCGDLLLRRLQRLLPTTDLLRAYATDLVVVTRDLHASTSSFGQVLSEYARVWPHADPRKRSMCRSVTRPRASFARG